MNVVVMWPPTQGGSDQLPYIARSLGLPKPLLEGLWTLGGSLNSEKTDGGLAF